MVRSAFTNVLADPLIYSNGVETSFGHSLIEKIDGRYGKKQMNPCVHVKELVVMPGSVIWDYPGWGQRAFTLPAWDANSILNSIQPYLDSFEYKMLNSIYKRTRPQDLSFNLFNFLYEARELPSLLDPLKVSIKRLRRTSPKGGWSKRSLRKFANEAVDDISSTYVNAQFGYLPTISDGNELMSRYGDLEKSYASLRRLEGTKQYFRFSEKDIQIPAQQFFYRMVPTGVIDILTDDLSWASIKFTKVSLSCSGYWTHRIPLLDSFAFLTSVLDKGGLHFDLATVWNAVPFSWLVDWIVPIGDALEANRQPWTEIEPIVTGVYTWQIDYEVRFPANSASLTAFKWGNRFPTSVSAGLKTGRIYFRQLIPPIDSYRFPPAPKFGEGWDLRKAGILAGIARGFQKK